MMINISSSHALRGNSYRPRCGLQRGALQLHSHAARGNERNNNLHLEETSHATTN